MWDGDVDLKHDESRWSCRWRLVPHGEPCEITFSFEEAPDIEYVQVAFDKADERSRTLQVSRWLGKLYSICTAVYLV